MTDTWPNGHQVNQAHVADIGPDSLTVVTPRLDLVSMSSRFLEASLDGRQDEAAALLGASVPAGWPGPWRRFLEMRLADLIANPAARPWLLRAIVLREPARLVVGIIGFHDPPGPSRTVEIGYAVESAHRRRGYAREAAGALIAWATRTGCVDRIEASVSPDNFESLGLIEQLGFSNTGRRWDEEDGWELVFERPV